MIRSSAAHRSTWLLLAVATGCGLAARAQDVRVADAIAAVKPAVVLVVATSPNQPDVTGTGFVVDRTGLIVTSAHVVERAQNLREFRVTLRKIPFCGLAQNLCDSSRGVC